MSTGAVTCRWPKLAVDERAETGDTLRKGTQTAGKVRLALEPMVNYRWHVPRCVWLRGHPDGTASDEADRTRQSPTR